jgi:hypothetical protein
LVAEAEDEDTRLDLFCGEQVEAAGLFSELHLCSGRGSECDIGQRVAKRRIACLIEGGKPAVEKMAGGGVGNEAHLVAEARQTNEDGGVNWANVVSRAGGHRSIGGIAEDDGVYLRWIVFVVASCGSGCSAGGTGSAGAVGGEVCMSVVLQDIEDCGERRDRGNDSKQEGSWAKGLAASDIEAGSGESGGFGGQGLLHD